MNGVILVNKPEGYTSRDVVNKLIHIFHTKKIGHTGTLDPIATGVMLICIGNHTKLVDILTSHTKEYIAKIKLGIKTDTGDITGNIINTDTYNITKEQIIKVLNSFLGVSNQQVPIYSAVKVNGKKLYEYARKNEEVKLPTREIEITDIELLNFKKDEIEFRVVVSKGTYIRSLIEDICTKLNTVGTMSKLIRTKQGSYSLEDCYSLEDIKNNKYKLMTKEEILKDYLCKELSDEEAIKIKNGAIIEKDFEGDYCCYCYQNKIIAIYQTYHEDEKLAKPYKMF